MIGETRPTSHLWVLHAFHISINQCAIPDLLKWMKLSVLSLMANFRSEQRRLAST
jgi:hypothetical protein